MKKTIIYNLIIIFITCLSCKAQVTQTLPIKTSSIGKPDNIYYKDIDNEFNKYEGTWKYEDGNTSFTITLEKKEMIYFETSEKYIDILCGEYSYIENSVTIVNTLPMLIQHPEFGYRNIGNGRIINNDQVLVCDDCAIGEKRVKLYFNDPRTRLLKPLSYFTNGSRRKHLARPRRNY